MKRLLFTLIIAVFTSLSAKALSYEEARNQAWYLTDKMAYELNLTQEQYDRVYQINLDYFLRVGSPADLYGLYWNYRDDDLRYVLYSWQYRAYAALDYFFRPLRWHRSAWHYPIFRYYRRGYYYFDRPAIYVSYYGGLPRGRHGRSPYRDMRPPKAGGPGMRDGFHGAGPTYRPTPGPQHPGAGGQPNPSGGDRNRGGFGGRRDNPSGQSGATTTSRPPVQSGTGAGHADRPSGGQAGLNGGNTPPSGRSGNSAGNIRTSNPTRTFTPQTPTQQAAPRTSATPDNKQRSGSSGRSAGTSAPRTSSTSLSKGSTQSSGRRTFGR